MFVVAAKSPFWKTTHFIMIHSADGTFKGARVFQRSEKKATRFTLPEAEEIAKCVAGGPNRWEVEIRLA